MSGSDVVVLPPEGRAHQIVSGLDEKKELLRKVDKTLQEEKRVLENKMLALKKCNDGKVTVEELKGLDVYLNLTNDNRTSEQGKEMINAEISRLEKQLQVCRTSTLVQPVWNSL